MTLVAKGSDVGFALIDGRNIDVSGSMLHDPEGSAWPSCSLLICVFKRGRTSVEMTGDERRYFGRGYRAHEGSVVLPPKSLVEWKRVGEVKIIFYERPGMRAPGYFAHTFGRRRWQAMFKKGKLPTLYKLGRAHRLELGPKCSLDDRGLIYP